MRTGTISVLALSALAILIAAGCSDEDDDDGMLNATLDELWPSEDGRWWQYDLRIAFSETGMDSLISPDDPLPSPARMRRIISSLDPGEELEAHDRELRTSFAGEIVTDSGASGQHLVDDFTDDPAARNDGHGDPFLPLLWRARPDLRDRLPVADKIHDSTVPYGVTGYCWEKTEDHIGGYGDLNTQLSWLYLKTPLKRGATFSLQLVPDLADDIWLHGLIVGQGTWTIGDVSYERAVEVFALIDMGIVIYTSDDGQQGEAGRSYMCYRTIFAPNVGPVYCREWSYLQHDPVLQDDEPGLLDVEAVLVDSGVPEDPH